MSKVYYSSTTSISDDVLDVIGAIENATSYGVRTKFLSRNLRWCLDSGGYTKPFVEESWKKRVSEYSKYIPTCDFVVVPDVVYNYKETLERFHKYNSFVKGEGFPSAFVSQDGIRIEEIPFSEFDVLFIGGSNEHKLGEEGRKIINYAKFIGKRIHVGRVNSLKRIKIFSDCDSWDGTHFGFQPSDSYRFANYIRTL